MESDAIAATEEGCLPEADSLDQPVAPHADDNPLLICPHNVLELGRETLSVTQTLTDEERLELAQEMTSALAERDRLEAEFANVKKDYKARIDLEVSRAAEAGADFRAGERLVSVSCCKFEDRTTLEIVFNDSVTGREVQRRPMTNEDRQLKLPLETHGTPQAMGETEPAPYTLSARTCINCGHFAQDNGPMPELCQTCSQCDSGDDDNWTPKRQCRTCEHKTTSVELFPCKGCALNVSESNRGEEDRWADEAAAQAEALPEAHQPLTLETPDSATAQPEA